MTQQIDTAVKAYCNAWLASFSEANPYHTVSIEADDIAHIKVAIEAALQAAQPAQPGWLPIESAPKDKSVLLYVNQFLPVYCGRKRHGNLGEPQQGAFAWRCDSSGRFSDPTHWQPLPAAPSTQHKGAEQWR